MATDYRPLAAMRASTVLCRQMRRHASTTAGRLSRFSARDVHLTIGTDLRRTLGHEYKALKSQLLCRVPHGAVLRDLDAVAHRQSHGLRVEVLHRAVVHPHDDALGRV
jgi:hypothetical protein